VSRTVRSFTAPTRVSSASGNASFTSDAIRNSSLAWSVEIRSSTQACKTRGVSESVWARVTLLWARPALIPHRAMRNEVGEGNPWAWWPCLRSNTSSHCNRRASNKPDTLSSSTRSSASWSMFNCSGSTADHSSRAERNPLIPFPRTYVRNTTGQVGQETGVRSEFFGSRRSGLG
jgi:hypothetical protein